jgi:uncharacterized protein DUF4038
MASSGVLGWRDEWRVRFSPPSAGVYKYRCESSDKSNANLNEQEGTLRVDLYQGTNSLLMHGPLKVSRNHRYFEHSDGTPFFWLDDTWWMGLCRRISIEEIKTLAADRKSKGFTVVQIVAGLYQNEPPFDERSVRTKVVLFGSRDMRASIPPTLTMRTEGLSGS